MTLRRWTTALVSIGVVALFIPACALAWGAEGHRVIAALAYERLTLKARGAVDQLIGHAVTEPNSGCPVASFEDASTWPDCVRAEHIRQFSWLTPDHFEDAPLCGHEPKAAYCPNGRCVTEETKRAIAILRDPKRSSTDRLEALEEVVHFVGDLHQPLHVTDNGDRGGNEVPVIFSGENINLHRIWDTELVVQAVGRSEQSAEAQLRPLIPSNAANWSRGGIDSWAAEAHQIGVTVVYPKLTVKPGCNQRPAVQTISPGYVAVAAPIVRQQLARAAVRLATVLNGAL